jgi:hypothetical protein
VTNFAIWNYDTHSRQMDVLFRDGEVRRYFGVPPIVHDDLIRSPYPHRSFYDNIVRCQYPYLRVA